MKKIYESPEAEIEQFFISSSDLIATSGNEYGDTGEDLEW